MSQPSDAPPAPPPPPPAPPTPQVPVPTVVVPGAPQLADALVPRSREALGGLRERLEQLNRQRRELEERRQELTNELSEAPVEARPGLLQRMQILDERILQLERDLAQTDRALAAAPAELLANTEDAEREMRERIDDAEEMAPIMFGVGVASALVLSRIFGWARRRRWGGRGAAGSDARGRERAGEPAARADDPRLAQLSQSVEAIALEVERIGEGQRFVTQLLAERAQHQQQLQQQLQQQAGVPREGR